MRISECCDAYRNFSILRAHFFKMRIHKVGRDRYIRGQWGPSQLSAQAEVHYMLTHVQMDIALIQELQAPFVHQIRKNVVYFVVWLARDS